LFAENKKVCFRGEVAIRILQSSSVFVVGFMQYSISIMTKYFINVGWLWIVI